MKINLYDMKNKGYFDAESVLDANYIYTFICGGRGIGKTYNVIRALIQRKITFLYLRRTQNESDLQMNELTSSITKILVRYAKEYRFGKLSAKVGCIDYDENGRIYTCALSTFASIRGINFDDVDVVVFDEFIKEPHVKKIKGEGFALANVLESIGRNRELDGAKPLRLIALGNSMDIANDIFMHYDVVSDIEMMMNRGDEVFVKGDKLLINCKDSPISKAKEKTSLYQNSGEEFAKMAIKNQFVLNDFSYVKKQKLNEYKVLFNVGDLSLYKHKSRHQYYVAFSKGKTKREYDATITGLEKFRRAEWRYYIRYLDGFVYFENYKACSLFEKYYEKQ